MHFVNGGMYYPGDIVEYPDHIKGGQWLEPVEDAPEPPKRRGRSPKKETS